MGRPCRYCLAAYPEIADEICEPTHRDEQRVYDLATAMAVMVGHKPPTDEQVGWFVEDADAVVDDFDPVPAKWRLRKLPDDKSGEFVARMRINDVTYVIEDGDKCKTVPVRLSALRGWQREADAEAALRLAAQLGLACLPRLHGLSRLRGVVRSFGAGLALLPDDPPGAALVVDSPPGVTVGFTPCGHQFPLAGRFRTCRYVWHRFLHVAEQ